MKKLLIILISLSIITQSCEHKDYEEPQISEPVFSLSGQRNGESFTLAAGVDGLIQTASIERNKYGVMEWRTNFIDASCPECDPVFSLILHDREGSTLAECADLELFAQSQLDFATEPSSSAYTDCQLSLNDNEIMAVFDAEDATEEGINSFSFDTEGTHEISAAFQQESDAEGEMNNVEIYQTIYAGQHHHMSAPFLYEVLQNDEDENQSIRVYFPQNDPQLRPTHWEINGISYSDESRTLEIPRDQLYEIALFFTNDAIGQTGSYVISFDHGFPINEDNDEENHIEPAPFITVAWATPTPNYEKAIIEYRWNGKVFKSTTPLNNSTSSFLAILGHSAFSAGLQGNSALSAAMNFSVKLTEVGNESNILELSNCSGTFGFVIPE